jgi:BlaI family penicillinase repressor
MPRLPILSRFEWQCLDRIWKRTEASVREIHQDLGGSPSYSTVRKIVERLEIKGAVIRARREGKAFIYKAAVAPPSMIRREIRQFVDRLFEGRALSLVTHLAEMDELTIEDLRVIESELNRPRPRRSRSSRRRTKPG